MDATAGGDCNFINHHSQLLDRKSHLRADVLVTHQWQRGLFSWPLGLSLSLSLSPSLPLSLSVFFFLALSPLPPSEQHLKDRNLQVVRMQRTSNSLLIASSFSSVTRLSLSLFPSGLLKTEKTARTVCIGSRPLSSPFISALNSSSVTWSDTVSV